MPGCSGNDLQHVQVDWDEAPARVQAQGQHQGAAPSRPATAPCTCAGLNGGNMPA